MTTWIIESALTVAIILLAGVVTSVALKRHAAALRHWVLATAVMCAWGAPVARIVLPSWTTVPIQDHIQQTVGGAASTNQHTATTGTLAAELSGDREARFGQTARVPAVTVANAAALWVVWIVGTTISGLTLVIGLARLRWLASRADVIDSGAWSEAVEEIRSAYGLSMPIRLLQSEHPALLIAWGWRYPTVLLPISARTWSRDRIEIVLAHELAHIARRDWFWQMAVAALRTVYWFNPLVWIASARLRAESEHACDDVVLETGIDGRAYAAHLVMIAQALRSPFRELSLPASAMARPSHLERRVCAMLNTELNRRPISWRARLATVGVLVGLTLGVAGVRGQSAYYKLSGTVMDSTGGVLPDTTLVLVNGTSGAKYEVRSDASGRFEFVGLPQARYTLQARLPGFATRTWSDLYVSTDIEQILQLHVGSLEETITVARDGAPTRQLDAAALQRREDARRRAVERVQRALARCATDGSAGSVGGNILVPTKVADVRPIYPEQAKALGVSGTVTMDAVIGTNGLVRDVKNISGPHPALEIAAADAVRQWEFTPTLLNCEAVEVNMRVTVNFAAQQ
jgi:TonB family protein